MKREWIQSLPNPTNALWKNLMLHRLILILNSDQDLALSWQKQILTGLLVKKIYKNRAMKISLFNYSVLGYISSITTSVPPFYRRNSCPTHIFKPTHLTGLQASSHSGIFQTNLPVFKNFLWISTTRSNFLYTIFFKKLDFPTANHNKYINLHWAQFPMIGNT